MKNIFLLLMVSCIGVFGQSQPPTPGNKPGTGGSGGGGGPGSVPANVNQFSTNGILTGISGARWTNLVGVGTTRLESTIVSNGAAAGSFTLYDANGITGLTFTATSEMFSNLVIKFPSAGTNGLFELYNDGSATNWAVKFTPLSTIADQTNHTTEAVGSIAVTNQVQFIPAQEFNGSNGTSAIALTNNWDMRLSTLKPITNAVGTNLTFQLSNMVQGVSLITHFKGILGYTNRVAFTVPSGGTNIVWQNWTTNGSDDVIVRPGYSYTVNFFATSQTNIAATVATDDPYYPYKIINLLTPAGFSRTNAIVGGTVHKIIGYFTNLNADITVFTNLATNTISGHTLTNNGDELRFYAAGTALAGTNNWRIIYGSQTILDTGNQTNLTSNYSIEGTITRTGNTEQFCNVIFQWGPGAGVAWVFTNNLVYTSQTNGNAATGLSLQGSSRRVGGITNNYFRLDYLPMPRL